jgi:1-acyl-sn-glycerol-3-phosphate acyltransferase
MRELLEILSREDLDPDDLEARDPEFIARYALPALVALRERYFRSEYEGAEYFPTEGPAIGISNHNGGPILADCWVMISYYWTLFGVERPAYAMVHDAVFRLPLLRNFLIKVGALRASRKNAEKVLDRGGVVLIFPGGELDCLRSFWRRHTIDFHGRSGFIELAMKRGVPVVPVVNVGGHETAVTLFSSRALARWTGLQKLTRVRTVPLSIGLPWGIWATGFVPFLPLPAKFSYKVGKPFYFRKDPAGCDDPEKVRRAYVAITDSMQDIMDELASRRRFPVIG